MNVDDPSKLSKHIRILIGLASIPSLLLAIMLIATIARGEATGISAFEVVYSLVGILGAYIAMTGKKLF